MIKPVKCGCGGEAIIYINGARQAKIYCEKCGIESNVFATKYEAITAWNRAMGERTAKVVKEDNIRICDNCSGLILIPFDKTEENLRKYVITGYKGHNIYFASYKYCPNCGAKLDWSGDE